MPSCQKWLLIFGGYQDTGGRAHILGHICCCSFKEPHNALSDHWFWVMILHTLNLMVPLFEQHFSLTWHGFATESVHSRDTQVQSQCQSIDQAPHIWIRLSGNLRLRRWSLRNPSSIWSCQGRRWRWLSWGNPPSPSQKGDLLVIFIWIPATQWVSPRHQWGTSGGASSSQCVITWQRSSMSWHNSWSARLPGSA